MRILVLGGYGLIGLAVVRRLHHAGHGVVALGRSAAYGARFFPAARWLGVDLAMLATPAAWAPYLDGVEAVVNASGALQDGARDNLARTQARAIKALIAACESRGIERFVQISAPGASPMASTAFLRTKAEADEALRLSTLAWVILKPGLVFGAPAYGGTALIRALAAFPVIQPLILPNARVQTVALDDVVTAVVDALHGRIPVRQSYDLVENTPHTLATIVAQVRRWQGFPPPRMVLKLPRVVGFGLARVADLAGWLGWRSALQTTALRVLENGVRGDPASWRDATGKALRPLDASLDVLPSTLQERIFARLMLLRPLVLLTLSGFWILSGLLALLRLEESARVLGSSFAPGLVQTLIECAAVADIIIGFALLLRRTARPACLAAVAMSILYLAGATFVVPALWLDPLGPLLKAVPAMVLALVGAALLEER